MASSVAQLGKRTMRIYALPLTPPRSSASVRGHNVQEHLTYYHFVTPPSKQEQGTSWTKWATNKATTTWADFGQAPEGNWKRRVYVYGERLVDRIDFEELALKSVDPSLGPKLSKFGRSETEVSEPGTPTISLIYPGTACSAPLAHLRLLLEKRTPRHRKGFWMWMILAPFTAPFMIIPIIPNLPFFFCVWRSWSHYRAYKASEYLEELLQRGAILPEESADLDQIYTDYAPTTPSASSDSSTTSIPPSEKSHAQSDSPPPLLLRRDAVPALNKLLHVSGASSFTAEMYRALEQARLRLNGKGHRAS